MAKKSLKLHQILKKLLFDNNMKPIDLARALNIPAPTIHRLVTGKSTRPHASSLDPIADFFSINVEQLLGEKLLPNEESKLPTTTNLLGLTKTIPILNWDDVNINNTSDRISNAQIAVSANINDACFALIMNDHSMAPRFPKKTILIFDPTKTPVDRSYILVNLAGKNVPIFRELLVDIDNNYLKPLNPDISIYKMRLLEEKDRVIACLLESRMNHNPDEEDNIVGTTT